MTASAREAVSLDLQALLARRAFVPDGTLLDCIELAEWLGPLMGRPEPPRIRSAHLQARWGCCPSTVSRRMHLLRVHQLIDASLHPGRGAFWEVRRVGPVP